MTRRPLPNKASAAIERPAPQTLSGQRLAARRTKGLLYAHDTSSARLCARPDLYHGRFWVTPSVAAMGATQLFYSMFR